MNTTRIDTLRVPGASLYYEVRGSGPVLLLIGAGAADSASFNGIAAHLTDHYTVVSYDRRGYARSPLDDLEAEQRLETHSDDAHHLLAAMGTEPALVFGSSGVYLSMILGANFSSESGPGIPLNVSLIIRFGSHVTTKKGTTWLFANEKGSHLWQVSTLLAPTESPKRFPKRSFPDSAEALPQSCCLSNVCRSPRPRSRLPVRVAASKPRQVKAAQEAGKPGAGALVLALTGVAHLSSRTGGSYPLLGAGAACASAASEISTCCPCRSACCSR